MREIKFRVLSGESFLYSESCLGFVGSQKNNNLQLLDFFGFVNSEFCEHPENIQQFTGLLDKKGKEIYEGDILKISGWRGSTSNVEVKWESVDASDDAGTNMVGFPRFDEYGDVEIIGNIFKNPELLK